jgi:predicted dehydrogenase
MDFGKGRQAAFTVSTQIAPYQRVNIVGTKARLEVEIPFNAPQGAAMTVYLDSGKKLGDASARAVRLPKADQYQLEGEQFSRVVRGREKLVYGVEDAILQARVLDALFRSEKSGNWEKP